MRIGILVAALIGALALTGAGVAGAAPVPEEERVPLDLRRTTLVVGDMERSLAFYRDALGMKVTYDNWVLTPRDAATIEEADVARRLVFLQANDDYVGVLGLLQYTRPVKPVVDLEGTAFHQGTAVLIFNLERLDEAFAKASAIEGVTVVSEPELVTYPSYDGTSSISVKVSTVQDPDGFTIELNQLQEALH
ncbi:MAG: VOC family protein [Xanthomonadales bacterium]|jgi:catechol 2,3-dioxygenase-like lactoylglutathione lyase family enzyme|nr:VOC family protein [Xanthomonadales bacterium]